MTIPIATKAILGTVPLMQAAALANDNAKFAFKGKPTSKGLAKQGLKNIVGTSLIVAEADLISGL